MPQLLLYCIGESTPSVSYPDSPGIDGEPIRIIESASLFAATSALSENGQDISSAPTIPYLLAYGKVVQNFAERFTVLPLRYGSLLESSESVKHLLLQNYQHYQKIIADIRGCVEMSIRIFCEAPEQFQQTQDTRDASGLAAGRSYLAQRKSYYARQEQQTQEENKAIIEFVQACQGLFVRYRSEVNLTRHPVFQIPLISLHFLLKKENEQPFRQALQTLKAKSPAQFVLTGPWPPYNFAEITSPDLPIA